MAQSSPSGSGDSPRKRSRLGRPEKLEDRILLSATWADADTGDPLDGATEGDDRFEGTGADEIASGLGGNDDLFGGGGSDELFGGGGDDTIDGGEGDDVAVFSGNASDFDIAAEPDGSYTVTDLRADSPDGTDGVDSVTDVETFRFADGDLHTPSSLGLDATADTNASVDARDPVAHWQFEADGVSDRVGDHDGSYAGDAGQNDVESRSASFDGSGDYVEIPHSSDLELDGGTIELNFRTDDADAKQGLFSKDSTSYDDGGHLTVWVNDGGIEVRLQSDDTSYWVQADGVVENGEWTNVQVSFGDGGLHLFVNGELADSNSYTGGLGSTSGGSGNTEPIVIGANAWQSGNGTSDNLKDHFQGEIADVAILADQLDVPDPADAAPSGIGLPADSGIANTDSYELVSHWQFNGSGVSDLVGNSDGTLEGGAAQGDTDGRSALFDGSNDYAELSHSDDLLLDNGRIELRFNSNDVDHKQALFSKDSSGYDDGGHITAWIDDGRVEIRIQSDSASYTLRSDAILSDNTWHDVAFEFGENGAKLIVDGVEQDTDAYTGGLGTSSGGSGNTEPIVIGANQWSSGDGVANNIKDHFDGRIADVAIYTELPQPDLVTLDTDVDGLAIDGVTQIVEGDRTFSIDPGDASVTLSYDVDSDSLTLEVVGGSSPITITGATGGAIDTIEVTGDIAGLESTADIGTLSIDATASVGSVSVGDGDGSIGLVEFTPGVIVDGDPITIDADIASVTAQGFASDITLNGEVTNMTVADSITGGARVTIDGVAGEVTIASEINGDSGLTITGHASAVEIGSEVDDTASISLSSVGELILGKVDTNASVSVSGDATSVEFSGRGIDSDLNGSLTIGGSAQQIDIGDDIGGTLDVGGDVGTLTLGDDIKSGASVTLGGDAGTISVPDAIKDGSVVAVAGHAETVEVGNEITGGSSVTVGSAGSFSTGTIEADATVEILGDVTSVSLNGNGTGTDLKGSLTIDGSAGSIDIGDDVMGQLEVDGDLGTLTIGDDIKDGAIVHVGGDATAISVGDVMRENATMTVDGHVESLEVVDGVTDGASVSLGGVDDVTIGKLASGTSLSVNSDAGTISVSGLGSGSDLQGTLTVGGSVETINIGDDIMGQVDINGDVGTLTAGDDIKDGAIVRVGGDVSTISVADVISGNSTLTVNGHVGSLDVADAIDSSTVSFGSAGTIETPTLSGGASINVSGHAEELRFSNDAEDGTSVSVGRAMGSFVLVDGGETHSHDFDELTTVLYDGSSLTLETADIDAGLVLHLDFSESNDLGADRSGLGHSGDAASVDANTGSGVFDGSDIIRIPSNSDINETAVTERTVSIRFKPDSVDGRSVVYEEGGGVRGLNIYIDDGEIMVGGYNVIDGESDWDGTYLSAGATEAGEWVTITVTLDGGPEVTDNALTVFRGGEEVASGEGSQLWNHPDPSGVGGVNNHTVFHDGAVYSGGYHFTGEIDDLRVYDRVVNDLEVEALAGPEGVNESIDSLGFTEANTSLAEDSGEGTIVGTLNANDFDEGETFTYALTADADGRFEVDVDGQVTVASGASFDHETEPSITLTAQVEDSAGHVKTIDIEVAIGDVNEAVELVEFAADPAGITETSTAGTIVGSLSATDPDDGETFTYTLSNDADGRFEVDADGQITVASGASFDHETEPSITLTAQVEDSAGHIKTIDIEVAVADVNEAIELAEFTAESAGITEASTAGTVVGSVTVTDPDVGETFAYTLTENADSRFEIDSNGQITVADGASFDHETEPTVAITAQVEDSAGHTRTVEIDVPIDDVNEAITDVTFTADPGGVTEASTQGTVVGSVAATDQDDGETFTYSLTEDANSRFEIDANGQIIVADGASFDHETEPTITVTAQVQDSAGHTETIDIEVEIADVNEAPTVSTGTFAVGEGGSLHLSVQALDAENDDLTYSWRQVGGPEASLDDASLATPVLTAPRVGEDTQLEFEVTVSDGENEIVQTVTVDVQSVDVEFAIEAGDDATVDEGETVELGVAITYSQLPEPAIDFGSIEINSHGGSSQDTDLSYTTEDTTIHLDGNGWKSIPMPITITADTILELEFRVGEPGEIQGIGFDSDGNVRNDNSSTTFRLDGTQDWGIEIEPIEGEPTEGWATYRIHVGEHFTGDFDRLILVNDDDAQRTEVSSSFRNVRVFEAVDAPTPDVELTWEQTGGPTVFLDDPSAQAPSFTSPDVDEPTELTFRVTAFDGEQSRTDEVTVLVNPVTAEAPPVGNTPVDNTPVDNTPVDNTPVNNTPVDNTPVDNTPVDNTPVDNTPVDNTPVDNTPVDNTPVDNTPVNNTPVDNTPVDNTPVDNTPVDNTPVDNTPVDNTPVDNTPVGNNADDQSDRILADRALREVDASADGGSAEAPDTDATTSDPLDRAAQAANTFRDQLRSRSAPDGAEDAIDRAEADARELVGIAEDAADGVGAGDGLADQPFELSAADRPVQLSEIEADRPFVLDVSPIDLEPVTDGTVLGSQTTRTGTSTDEHSDPTRSRDDQSTDVTKPGIAALFWHLVRGLTGRSDDSTRKER
ncbi:MAG: LamG-like jellyroll fold domain-containing protein [Planctomycetota bacterium]